MSRRTDELEQQLRTAQDELADVKRDLAEVSGANGMVCAQLDKSEKALARVHADREKAWKQVVARDQENTKLAKELEAAVAAQGSMPADLIALKRIVTDHIVESMTGPTYGIVLARRLRTEMVEAGFPVATEVEIRAQLGGVS